MKSKMKIKKTVVESLVCLSIAFSIGSCAGDGFDEETFSGGVTGTQLLSPEASGVEFAKLAGTTNCKGYLAGDYGGGWLPVFLIYCG